MACCPWIIVVIMVPLLVDVSEGQIILSTNVCPTNWRPLYTSTRSKICLRINYKPMSWSEAEESCRRDGGRLLDVEGQLYQDISLRRKYEFDNDLKEFWTGIYLANKRSLLTSGIPPKQATVSMFAIAPWNTGQPSTNNGSCVSVNVSFNAGNPQLEQPPSFVYGSSLTDCRDTKHYICVTEPLSIAQSSGCPDGYVGDHRWPYCYMMSGSEYNGTYNQAEEKCKKDGDEVAEYESSLDYSVLATAGKWFIFAGRNRQIPYYVKNKILKEGSGDDQVNNRNCHLFDASINSESETGSIQPGSCTTAAGVICQRLKSTEVKQATITSRIESIYSDQVSLRGFKQFTPQPIKCISSRTLTDLEVVLFRLNSEPYFIPVSSEDTNKHRNVTQIRVPGNSDYDTFVGEYTCVVLHKILNTENKATGSVYVKYVDTDYVIYRGSVGIKQPLPDDENLLRFNIGQGIESTRIRNLNGTLFQVISRSMFNVQMELLEGQGNDVLTSYDQKVNTISDGGRTFKFSVFVTMKQNNTWFNSKHDQFMLTEFVRNLKIRFSQVPVRRKRETDSDFDPNTVVVKSTGSCAPLQIYNRKLNRTLYFPASEPRELVSSIADCITDRRPLATAKCSGSMASGFELTDVQINQKCVFDSSEQSSVTSTLQAISLTNVTPKNVKDITTDTVNLTSTDDLTSLDVIYTAEILDNIAKQKNIDNQILEDVVKVVSNIINLAENILKNAQTTGSATSRIVEALETIASKLTLPSGGVKRIIQSAFVVDVRDISNSSDIVVGLQLDETVGTVLTNGSIKTLPKASSLNTQDADAAIVLPAALIKDNKNTKLTMLIYGTVKLFRDTGSHSRFRLNGKVAAATLFIDGKAITDLGSETVKTVFKPVIVNDDLTCGYWNYSINSNAGGWATNGCSLQGSENDRSVCVCDHLTNFAILIDTGDKPIDPDHDTALSIISIIGLSLSIIGLSLTVLTFIFFKALRKGRGQQTLFNLALSMLISWIVFLVGIKQTSSYGGCIAVATFLHYLILATFMWMLIEGFLQYLRFVKVLGTYIPRFMLKVSLVAWGVPLIPVITVLAIDYDLYFGGKNYCWMSTTALYYSFLLPVGLIIVVNIIVFALVIKNLISRPKGLQTNQSEQKRLMMNFWAALSVFVLLGLTWIFGFFAINEAREAFLYLFTIFNSIQGFFIFILFTFREPQVRQHWRKKLCGKKKEKYTSGDSSSTSRDKKSKTTQSSTQFSDLSGFKNSSSSHAFLDQPN